jgi:NADH:ubiquinone oxidoreductase subunit C
MEAPEDHVKIVEELREAIGAENVIDWKIPRAKRIYVSIKAEKLKDTVKYLVERNFEHISTISGVDVGDGIEILYHLTRQGPGRGITISLRVKTPMENASLPTITDIIPGATFYEREVHDFVGVVFVGHSDLSPVMLPDKWPKEVYPLLKKWKIEDIKKRLSEVGGN